MRARLVQRPDREDIDERATALALAWAPGSVGPCRIRLWWRPRPGGDHRYQRGVHHHDHGPHNDHNTDTNDNDDNTDTNDDDDNDNDDNDNDNDNDNDPRTDTDDHPGSYDDDLPSKHDYDSGGCDGHHGFTAHSACPQQRRATPRRCDRGFGYRTSSPSSRKSVRFRSCYRTQGPWRYGALRLVRRTRWGPGHRTPSGLAASCHRRSPRWERDDPLHGRT